MEKIGEKLLLLTEYVVIYAENKKKAYKYIQIQNWIYKFTGKN